VIDFPAMRHTTKLAAVLLAGALLSACGSAENTPNPGGTSSAGSFEDYQLSFARCMREHGIDLPDPSADGSVQVPAVKDMTAFTAASDACQKKLGQPPAPDDGQAPKSDEERLAEMVKTAECFRAHGVNVPDPKPGETITIPMDAPSDVMEACAPDGISGPAAPGGK
jgi:hypothetical protein